MARNCKSSLLIRLVVGVTISIVNVNSLDVNICKTPDGEAGSCISIKQCKTVIDFLSKAPRPLSKNTKQKLISYTCGYEIDTVKVCCPPRPLKIEENSIGMNPSKNVSAHEHNNLLPKDCGYVTAIDKLRRGNEVSLNEFPWIALLSYKTDDGPKFKCAGSVINDQWILTAAHCVTNLNDPLLGVRVGEHNILTKSDCEIEFDGTRCSEPVQDLSIEKIIPHPGFNVTVIKDDIALLKVSKINLSIDSVKPVCLPTDTAINLNIKGATVIGWGITGYGQGNNVLKQVILPIVDREKCQLAYNTNPRVQITEKQICADGKDRNGFCPGDSGGPLLVAAFLNDEVRYVQKGIMSFGPKRCGLENFPGVYTRVASYVDWILDTISS